MRNILTVAICLVICALAAGCSGDENLKARTEKLPAFSITLPEGWATNIPGGLECTVDRCLAGFTDARSGARSALTVSVVPNLGKSLDEIVEESRANMAAHEAVMNEVERSETRVEYQGTIRGNPARLVATFDAARQQVGILLLVGENAVTTNIVRSLRMENPVLDFKVR